MNTSKNQSVSLDVDILIDPDDAGKLLGIPAATLSKWRSTGENNLPYVKIGRAVRYRTADLRAWIERHTFDVPASKRRK